MIERCAWISASLVRPVTLAFTSYKLELEGSDPIIEVFHLVYALLCIDYISDHYEISL